MIYPMLPGRPGYPSMCCVVGRCWQSPVRTARPRTSSLLAWILEYAGLAPGFLIGGIPANFGQSARLGASPFFVVEADEYDTAFFDKRSKFVHYRPRTLILNNLEFDHADIFPDLAAIQRQFHHLLRTVPGSGLVVANGQDANLAEVLAMGCWTPVERFGMGDWEAREKAPDGSAFDVYHQGERRGRAAWTQLGMHNVHNALAAIAAARHVGVSVAAAIEALRNFQGVKRRLETRGVVNGVTVYDDFAHHPTAIATTLAGLRARVGAQPIIAVLEPRSNTMKMGVFKDTLAPALNEADRVVLYQAPGSGLESRCRGGDARFTRAGLPQPRRYAGRHSGPAQTGNPGVDHEQWRFRRHS